MSIQSRSGDLLRMEETIRKVMGDLFSRLDESNQRRDQADHTYDQTLKELRDGFVALKVQNSERMVKLMADNGGNSSAALTGSNTRAQCFSTRQSKVDSPIVFVNDLNGSGTGITAPKLLQSPASTTPKNLQPRDKSVEECIPRFPAEISNFIGSNFSNPMVELRSLKQLGMVSDYLNQFKTLLAKVELTESYVVHLFVSGLNYHVQKSVKMFKPKSLVHAFALARLQDRRLFTSEGMGRDEKLKQLYRMESEEDVVEGEIGKISECGEATEGEGSECGEAAEGKHSECGEATEEGNIGDEAMDDDNPLTSINVISGLTTKVNSVMVDVAEMCDAMCTATSFTTAKYRKTLDICVSGFDVPRPVKTFEDCGFSVELMKAIAKQAYEKPTPIQCQALPIVLSGRDIIGIAKNGLRKDYLICASYDMAHQIYLEAKKFSKSCGIRVAAVYGGMSKLDQFKELKAGCEIVVATPGRLMDMIKMKALTMLRATYLVLDEADRMFDLGFEPQIRSIVGQIRPDRQTLLFSATRPRKVEKLVREILPDPVRVTVGEVGMANEDITQIFYVMPSDAEKLHWLLEKLAVMIDEGRVLVFALKKAADDEVEAQLLQRGLKVAAFHGDKDQSSRLDIKSITSVVNFDIAKDMDMHVHRIGRTGRAGDKDRTAYTLITQKEARFAGELVNSLIAADQNVSPELMDLARTDGRFKSKQNNVFDGSFDEESRLYVGKLHEETPMLQDSFEVLVADCSQLLHRRPFFKLSEVVLEFGNRMNGGVEQALHSASFGFSKECFNFLL
ncbi:hypothetical protein SASPL_152550 [Salvia splendens]|uniref:RNA helicase n=1 Tax=Salvia splendens TaxID=180675 RepID=A0A8X8W3K7_SALSN|nr:hypothetical protein SASPL_152550 [Salvia splendens]